MGHQTVQAGAVQHVGVQGPVGADALRGAEGAVGILVVEEARLFVPQVLADVLLQHLGLVLEVLNLLPAFQVEAHLEQEVGREELLQVGVQPDHVPVAVDGAVAFGHAGHVVHPRAPAAGPVHAVAPRVVQAQPFVVSAEGGEYLVQAFRVAELVEVDHLAPGHQVGPGADGVITLEAVGAVGLDLAADEAVGMLLGVEVVQRLLEGEEPRAVAGEHQDERRIPHEDIAVVGRVQVAGYEA